MIIGCIRGNSILDIISCYSILGGNLDKPHVIRNEGGLFYAHAAPLDPTVDSYGFAAGTTKKTVVPAKGPPCLRLITEREVKKGVKFALGSYSHFDS